MRDNTEAATLGFMFPSMQPFSTPPTHFLHDRASNVHCNKTAWLSLHKSMYTCTTAGVCELSEECVLRNQGESFLVSVPAIVLSP